MLLPSCSCSLLLLFLYIFFIVVVFLLPPLTCAHSYFSIFSVFVVVGVVVVTQRLLAWLAFNWNCDLKYLYLDRFGSDRMSQCRHVAMSHWSPIPAAFPPLRSASQSTVAFCTWHAASCMQKQICRLFCWLLLFLAIDNLYLEMLHV